MKKLFSLVLYLLATAFIPATGAAGSAQGVPLPGGMAEPIYVAVLDPLALENACACVEGYAQRNYHALAAYLSLALHRQTLLEFSTAIDVVRRRIGRDPDLVIGKTSVLRAQVRQLKLPLFHLAALTDKTGSVLFHGLFIVRRDDKAKTIADLKGRTILFGPVEAVEKHRAALEALKRAGVEVTKPLQTRSTCSVAAQDVAAGRADAAVISSYALPLLEGCKTIKKGSLKVIGKTDPVPFVGVFAAGSARFLLLDDIKRAFLSVRNDKGLLKKLESKEGFVDIARISREIKERGKPPAPEKEAVTATAKKDVSPARNNGTAGEAAPGHGREPEGWIDWRGGRRRDGVSRFVPSTLPEKPDFIWRLKTNAQSLGGIAATRELVIFSDKTLDKKKDLWRCVRASDGSDLWRLEYPAEAKMDYTSAPRATPVIAQDRVYLLGALGDLHCVELKTGKVIWKLNILKRWGGKLPVWGFCGTPLLVDGMLVLQTTAPGANLVAIDGRTAKEIWRTATQGMAYGNLIVAEFGGVRQIVGYDEKSAGGWDVRTGRRLWKLVPPADSDFNVPTPLPVGNKLLLATENNGTRLYAFDSEGRIIPTPLSTFEDLTPNTTSPVLCDGTVWASCYDGLFCLDPARGLRCLWKSDDEIFCDHSSIIAGNGHVLISLKAGKLALFPARPEKPTKPLILTVFKSTDDLEPELWSHPAIVGDRIYLRSDSETAALRLPAPQTASIRNSN